MFEYSCKLRIRNAGQDTLTAYLLAVGWFADNELRRSDPFRSNKPPIARTAGHHEFAEPIAVLGIIDNFSKLFAFDCLHQFFSSFGSITHPAKTANFNFFSRYMIEEHQNAAISFKSA